MEESTDETYISIASLIIFLLLVIYIVGGSFMEHKKILFGHETGIAIALGMIVSLIVKLTGRNDEIYKLLRLQQPHFLLCVLTTYHLCLWL